MYINNFDDWGTQYRNRLNINKKFREVISKIFSKTTIQSQTEELSINYLDNDFTIYYSEKFVSQMGFCVTNHLCENKFFNLNSYRIEVGHPDLDEKFEFSFNFSQMKVISKVGKKFNLRKFFSKMLTMNNKMTLVNLDKSYFNVFSDFMLDFLDKHKRNLINNNDNSKYLISIK